MNLTNTKLHLLFIKDKTTMLIECIVNLRAMNSIIDNTSFSIQFHATNIKTITEYSKVQLLFDAEDIAYDFVELHYMSHDIYIYDRHNMKFQDVPFAKVI